MNLKEGKRRSKFLSTRNEGSIAKTDKLNRHTEYGKENHESSRYLNDPSTANPSQGQETSIFSAREIHGADFLIMHQAEIKYHFLNRLSYFVESALH